MAQPDLVDCPACGNKAVRHSYKGKRGITKTPFYREWVSCSKLCFSTKQFKRPGQAVSLWNGTFYKEEMR